MLVDCDPQANSTSGLGLPYDPARLSSYDLLMDDVSIDDVAAETDTEQLYLVPSSRHLAGANVELVDEEVRETRLRDKLEAVRDKYDFILLDCPPALDLLTVNALAAADSVLIPIQCEYFALERRFGADRDRRENPGRAQPGASH